MEKITTALKRRNQQIAKELDEKFEFSLTGYDGGILADILGFTNGFEPREEFISLNNLVWNVIKIFHTKAGRRFMKRMKHFKGVGEGFDRLIRLEKFSRSLCDWHVDAYIHYRRLKQGKIYDTTELDAIESTYFQEVGENRTEYEQVLLADNFRKDAQE